MEQRAHLTGAERELARLEARRQKLVQSIMDGVPGSEVKDEMIWPFRMSSVEEVRWYFEQRRAHEQTGVQPVEIVRFEQVRWAHDAHRFEALYKAWLADGDGILDTLATPGISYSISRGAGKIEAVVLPYQYTHLSPLVAIS
jgi:hypothetical protein